MSPLLGHDGIDKEFEERRQQYHRGHHVDERYLFEGITQFVVREHGDGLVSGRGSHASALAARAEIDRCCDDRSVYGCALQERADLTAEELSHDVQARLDYASHR